MRFWLQVGIILIFRASVLGCFTIRFLSASILLVCIYICVGKFFVGRKKRRKQQQKQRKQNKPIEKKDYLEVANAWLRCSLVVFIVFAVFNKNFVANTATFYICTGIGFVLWFVTIFRLIKECYADRLTPSSGVLRRNWRRRFAGDVLPWMFISGMIFAIGFMAGLPATLHVLTSRSTKIEVDIDSKRSANRARNRSARRCGNSIKISEPSARLCGFSDDYFYSMPYNGPFTLDGSKSMFGVRFKIY